MADHEGGGGGDGGRSGVFQGSGDAVHNDEEVVYEGFDNGAGGHDVDCSTTPVKEGCILSTFMVLNASVLLEAKGVRLREFMNLMQSTNPLPNMIIVHEVNGYSGEKNLRSLLLRGPLRFYELVYSQRLKHPETGARVGRAGGGIMCLFNKSMFRANLVPPPDELDTSLLDGHVRTFCFWRKEYPSIPPLIVTVAYIPPEDAKKNTELRLQGLAAVPAMVNHVKKFWRGSQHVVVSHVNAPDACQVLRTQLREALPVDQVVALPLLVGLPDFQGPLGMRFWRMSTNEVFHQRLNIKSMGKATPQGRKFYQAMARNGMLPMMGVSGRIQPSSWRKCAKPGCAVLCTCGRFGMSGQNDVMFVQQEVLWHGLRSGLAKSTLRRVRWGKSIDHSILFATVPLMLAVPRQHIVPRIWSTVKRLRLPESLLLRAQLLRIIGTQQDEALKVDPSMTASAAWSQIGGSFYVPTMVKGVMTSEELSAAFVNAPRAFWDFQEGLEKDAGSRGVVSSANLLDCICDCDGHVVEGDSTKTGEVILRYRQTMAQFPRDLVCGDDVVFEALRSVSNFNKTVPELSPESAAFKVAQQPDHYWRAIQARRSGLPCAPLCSYGEWLDRTPEWSDSARSRYDELQVTFQDACRVLNADITMKEVTIMLARMKDVGASLDNVPPVVMQSHASHIECEVIKALTQQFNVVFKTGVAPRDWQKHRMLLVHKGHGASPSALDSYRAIGIGCCDLKMLSLILEERLNTFLRVTNSLSHNQMGFKRASGTREATLALSEIIKEASKKCPVLTAFIDVRAAYDSVIREVLYAKMLRMGIGGRFLTTIQGLYHSMEAELEVGGAMIGKVTMEMGLAQGSPLSPVLFNIYINSCINDLERLADEKGRADDALYGLHVPSAIGDMYRIGTRDIISNNRIASIWFADDSSVVETNITRLQWLVDTLVELLRLIGLTMNDLKTKYMITMRQGSPVEPLVDLGLKVQGKLVALVTEFPHLGTTLNSRGNWKDAWAKAAQKAGLAYHDAVAGGLFFHAGSMAFMVTFCRAKIWSYFDAIMAVTGAGGSDSSAFFNKADESITKVLKSIAGYARCTQELLRIESGLWDTRTRADMLVMRFFTKICSADHDSLIWRVVRMSMQQILTDVRKDPCKKWSFVNYVHRQSWVQQVLAAAERLRIPCEDVLNMTPGMLLVVQEGRAVGAGLIWEEVASPLDYTPVWDCAVRFLIRGLPLSRPYIEGVDYWLVCKEHVGEGPILRQLSEPLRLANFAAIRWKANIYRRELVKAFVVEQLQGNANPKGWAAIAGYSSFMPSYWYIDDVKASRLMLRARLHCACNELYQFYVLLYIPLILK